MTEDTRKTLGIDRELAEELRVFTEKKHGFSRGAVKIEAEKAIRNHIRGGGA